MSTKHTPGPWWLGRHPHNIVGLVNGDEEIVAQIGDMPCVGGFDDAAAERGSEMEKANARLIAAAPDLLEALRFVVERFEADKDGFVFSQRLALTKASAAIAKATGEQA